MKSRTWIWMTVVCLSAALATPVQLAAQNAQGLKETVLYTFTGGTDGAVPSAAVIQDEQGNLYGTTTFAGDLSASACVTVNGTGCGVVFKIDPKGNYTVLYTFTGGADGGFPYADLVRDEAGNLYGTASEGGDLSSCGGSGCGVVFMLDPKGNYSVLHAFTGSDGAGPYGGLVRDKKGNLYGTTYAGGASLRGVVFELDPTGKESVLYSFTGGADGSNPFYGDLLRDEEGNLYGTTYEGGDLNCYIHGGCGVVFKVDPTGKETVLYTFTGADGRAPEGSLVRDEAGNLYGTTGVGGNPSCFGGAGCGVVFKVDPTDKETVLYAFTGGTDGRNPLGGLVRDQQGNLYGTTPYGGDQGAFCAGFCGVVFKVDPTGKETVLYTFTGMADGATPLAGLLRDKDGNLYGTTQLGGDLGSTQGNCGPGCGVVFKIAACTTALCQGGL
jgi:uncharacterized repeat protein (TIGR03803 family)